MNKFIIIFKKPWFKCSCDVKKHKTLQEFKKDKELEYINNIKIWIK